MQLFIAELSHGIEKEAFTQSWQEDLDPRRPQTSVEFTFAGRRVSAVVKSDPLAPWPSAGFHQAFSAAIRRIDHACNVRWI